ncbi:MAG: FkbM family methyltransferase [Cyanobacteria bacterium P01_F01_bin.13]
MIKALFQETIILLFRPLIVREVPSWGKIYQTFVGDRTRNWFWQDAKKKVIKGKLHPFLMELDLSKASERSTFFLSRWYDIPVQQLIEQTLNKGDEVLDIGANIGMFSLMASHVVGSEGIIHAVEPNPEARQGLNHNIGLNHIDNIKVYPFGLGESEKKANLYVPDNNSEEGSLARVDNTSNGGDVIPVDIKVGDEVLQKIAPRLIKIDVEGSEVEVMRGLSQLIDSHLPLIIAEYSPTYLHSLGHSFDDFLAIAKEHSYRLFKVGLTKGADEYNLVLTPIEDADINGPCDILLGHGDDPYIQKIQ